jgi:outer membrane protein
VKIRVVSIFVLALMGASQLALANTAATKFGFVNSDRIMRESAPAKSALQRIEQDFSKRDQELQGRAKELDALQKDLEDAGAKKLSESERQKKERVFNEKNRVFQRMQRDLREEINQRRNEAMASIIEKTNQAIKRIAESEKYDVILQEAVYVNPRVDITDKVLKALESAK